MHLPGPHISHLISCIFLDSHLAQSIMCLLSLHLFSIGKFYEQTKKPMKSDFFAFFNHLRFIIEK